MTQPNGTIIRHLLLPIAFLLFFAGCAPKKVITPKISTDIAPFLEQVPEPPAPAQQRKLYTDFLAHRYAPWQLNEPNATVEEATWAVEHFGKKRLYGENLQPLDPGRFKAWVRNARYDAYNTLRIHAVVTHPTSLRLFPTRKPIFLDPSKSGEGYPFDYNQNSALKAMTPLIVSHLSLDGGWAFVQSPFALGWVPVRDLAPLKEEVVQHIMQTPLAVWLQDNAPLHDDSRYFLFYAKLGTLFPVKGGDERHFDLAVVQNCDGIAHFVDAPADPCRAAAMPLAMTKENIKRTLLQLMDEPYGWGGLNDDRDCSATVRDFFTPFGIWLPRNSKEQAEVGRVIDLSHMTAEQKERTIIEEGIPFRTLLYIPGHIMLYVGQKEGRAYAFHNMWGIRMRDGERIVVGRAVITDLWLGENLPESDPEALPIRRIESMNLIISPSME